VTEQWQLRPMQPQDIAPVVAIEQAVQLQPWSENMLSNCLATPHYQCWVAEVAGTIVGFVVASIQLAECHILNIGVLPRVQRQGIGSALLAQILQIARGARAQAAYLEVRLSNQPAIHLYQRFSFKQTGLRKNY
jgi:ribosomal-protein-alanine N-acetyltransferase